MRFLLPAGGAVVIAAGAASSAPASDRGELVLSVHSANDCSDVRGPDGQDVLCASRGRTVVGRRKHPSGRACPTGGEALSWGTDANGNGVLDPSELEGSTYVCRHARGGGRAGRALVATTALAPRDGNCPAGGSLVQSGIDRDGDGRLAANEIERATFACDRFGGVSVPARVEVLDEPPGAACASGGKRVEVGHEGEAPRISYACDAP